ncbi:PREDICTED: psbP domain-containing protein 3, chloroplastic isoform X1 [Populus euphratica]|uniref:PsbP domain-containing protein 3, chloroplastic isoform X1 n=2 Tax=Populus euphratica TaxID=75702 RepID=A0AAJ6Y3L6_POPEU|nr:PREDICTED: psbP domain-containing protein 3, chloroplastic isoform X1 [Populus euphratica]
MACISSLNSLSQRPFNPNFSSFSSNKPSLYILKSKLNTNIPAPSTSLSCSRRRNQHQHVLCSNNNYKQEEEDEEQLLFCLGEVPCGAGTKRREALFNMVFTALTFPAIASTALAATGVAEDLRVYTDDANKFKISIPQGWQVGAGEPSGYKSVTAFYPEEASNSSVSVVITGLGPDFTRLESFGKVDAFAETLVGGLDRSWQRPPGVAAKLIDSKAANGLYYIEYTLQNPGESRRHLLSALGVAFNGWYNRLYTVTGQFVDEESEKFGTEIRKAVSSFRFI